MMLEDQEQQNTPETEETAAPEIVAVTSTDGEIESTDAAVDAAQEKNISEANEEVKAVEAEEDHEAPKDKKLAIPDFDALSIEAVLESIEKHIKEFEPQRIKGIVESGRSRILQELNAERDAAKATYLEEGGNIIDFEFNQPQRKTLGILYGGYRDRLRAHYAQLEAELSTNLAVKTAIIEEVKALPMAEGSAKEKYETFKALRERWNQTGLVPKADARTVWANYNHHVDNFFNFLRLAYDLIEKDYQNNYDEKVALCQALEDNIQDGASPGLFRTLQQTHSKWKRIGPVPREQKDALWDRLKAATAKVHELRDQYNENLVEINASKIAAKKVVAEKIEALTAELPTKHSGWQKSSKALEALRAEFKAIGFVKSDENDNVWEAYKAAQRGFNKAKNEFYKEEKIRQRESLEKKKALITLAESLKDSDDIAGASQQLKQAQADWKNTGYVPKKEGDKLWEAFRAACNHFFDRLKGERKAKTAQDNAVVESKQKALADLKKAKIGTIEEAIEASEQFSAIGVLTGRNRKIDQDFDTLLSEKVSALGLEPSVLERTMFEAKVKALVEADDQDGLHRQRSWIREEMDKTKKELHQLENNIAFFSGAKGNPLLDAALDKIEAHKARVEELTALRKLFNSLLK
ncbi:MAG: Uncharacterised protein [Flavobacteriales bacterium UBA4585]|nr:MAG: Uncharacterised protein [Flavobacteriales bacterium UBA4585]